LARRRAATAGGRANLRDLRRFPCLLDAQVQRPADRERQRLWSLFFSKRASIFNLLDAVENGVARDRRRECETAFDKLRNRFESLTEQHEIMIQATTGRLNEQIAYGIGLAEATVKVHRSDLMRKMKARSLPELNRMATDKLGPGPEQPPRS
jgi:DNA-binding CsgD family transcriptional regulator